MGTCIKYDLLLVSLVLSLLCTSLAFNPVDNYLIDCGSQFNTPVAGRVFVADNFPSKIISTPENIIANIASDSIPATDHSPLYRTARILTGPSSYRFSIQKQGRHWIRLHFFPFVYKSYNLNTFRFSVSTDKFVLLKGFQADNDRVVFKEYLVNIVLDDLVLSFTPLSNSFAFINAIEVVSVPDELISDKASTVNPLGEYHGMLNNALETLYRVNMGGPKITPSNDSLSRSWDTDHKFLLTKNLAIPVVYKGVLNYLKDRSNRDTAPDLVYRTAMEMMFPNVSIPNFNATWEFDVDPTFRYLVRMHFCDIVSTSPGELYFNVYLNFWTAINSLDLSNNTAGTLAVPNYWDFVTGIGEGSQKLRVSIAPLDSDMLSPNPILNGLEIMKMNNSEGSLDGLGYETLSSQKSSERNVGVIVGSIAGAFVVFIFAVVLCLMCRRRKLKAKQHSKTSVSFSMSRGNKVANGTLPTTPGLNSNSSFHFSLAAVKEATNSFDENLVVGVGGFGKVYKGTLKDEMRVAVKRAHPGSKQGQREFQTEIEMLSHFRHRHLVTLIGYCDEHNEMILVYEYMENGPLKNQLYGSDLPSLSWQQRLQICIESARGLHYLHTGSTKAIIHRDVKSANILIDKNFMAKVADFGLSKAGPELDQTHVSTAVKGSFGYLDPEYFRRQQLTEKSDVYSFGVVLLEVVCARAVVDPSLPREMVSLVEWGMKWQRKGELDQIIDPCLAGQIRLHSLRKFGDTVEKCLNECGVDRPTMGDVLWNLEYALQLQKAVKGSDGEGDQTNMTPEVALQVESSTHMEGGSDTDLLGRVFAEMVKSQCEEDDQTRR